MRAFTFFLTSSLMRVLARHFVNVVDLILLELELDCALRVLGKQLRVGRELLFEVSLQLLRLLNELVVLFVGAMHMLLCLIELRIPVLRSSCHLAIDFCFTFTSSFVDRKRLGTAHHVPTEVSTTLDELRG